MALSRSGSIHYTTEAPALKADSRVEKGLEGRSLEYSRCERSGLEGKLSGDSAPARILSGAETSAARHDASSSEID